MKIIYERNLGEREEAQESSKLNLKKEVENLKNDCEDERNVLHQQLFELQSGICIYLYSF
jgi:hypothetical protein